MKQILSRDNLRIVSGMAALALLCMLPSILAITDGKYPFDEDSLSLFGPWREWTKQLLHAGTLPLWNPHFFSGMPFMSNGQTSVLYPVNIVYWIFPLNIGLVLDTLFHTILLGCGGYLLARSLSRTPQASLLCAICLMMGNGVAAHLFAGHTTWHAARAYLPLIIWTLICFYRKKNVHYLWGLAVLMALQVFAGYPPYVLWSVCWCLVFSAIWWWARQQPQEVNCRSIKLKHFFLPTVLVVLLSAAVVLPLRETNNQGRALTYKNAVRTSSTVNGWVRLALPNFFGGNRNAQWSITSFPHEEVAYISLLPLGLALFSPLLWRWQRTEIEDRAPGREEGFNKQRFINLLWWILPFAMIMALGKNTPLYQLLFDYFPPLRLFRVPARWFEIWYFAACILAAFGWDALLKLESQHLKRLVLGYIGVALLFAGVAIAICVSQPQSNYWMEVAQWNNWLTDKSPGNRLAYAAYLRFTALQSIVTGCILAMILALVLNKIRESEGQLRSRCLQLLLTVVIADLLVMFWMSARFAKDTPAINPWTPEIVARYQKGQRWNTGFKGESAAYGLNLGLPHGIDILGGYDTMAPRGYFEFANAIEKRSFWSSSYQANRYDPLWRVAGVTHVLAVAGYQARQWPHGEGEQIVAQLGKEKEAIYLWKMPSSWPRAYLTSLVVRKPRTAQLPVLSELAERNIPAALVENSAFGGLTFAKSDSSKITDLQWHTNRTTMEVETDTSQVLVLSDANAPGWRAWVNGREHKVETTNYVFRSIEVPPGRSKVVFAYDNQTHRTGVFLSLCGLALLAGALSFVISNRQKPLSE